MPELQRKPRPSLLPLPRFRKFCRRGVALFEYRRARFPDGGLGEILEHIDKLGACRGELVSAMKLAAVVRRPGFLIKLARAANVLGALLVAAQAGKVWPL